MQRLWYPFVWLKRIGYCRGFGIQSPTDYWIVRYVINEHWPYYLYDKMGLHDSWLRRKLGRLYFRIANWLQPESIVSDDYQEYLHNGCRQATFGTKGQLVRITLDDASLMDKEQLYNMVNDDSVLIVEGIQHFRRYWAELIADDRVRITFDLYYCGMVLFDRKRHKTNYIVNF